MEITWWQIVLLVAVGLVSLYYFVMAFENTARGRGWYAWVGPVALCFPIFTEKGHSYRIWALVGMLAFFLIGASVLL